MTDEEHLLQLQAAAFRWIRIRDQAVAELRKLLPAIADLETEEKKCSPASRTPP